MMTPKDSLSVIKKHWNQMPVPVDVIAFELGLGPKFAPLPDQISGAIRQRPGDGYEIVVNKEHSKSRQRFTIAHELGHYIYHRDLLGKGTGDTRAFRAEGSGYPNPHIALREEREANTFAANLLMPNHLIDRLRAEGVRDPETMARRLGVSTAAMRIKLGLPAAPSLFG